MEYPERLRGIMMTLPEFVTPNVLSGVQSEFRLDSR